MARLRPLPVGEATLRRQDARDALLYLRRALRCLHYAPQTRKRVRAAITSAGGAVRHAERVLSVSLDQATKVDHA